MCHCLQCAHFRGDTGRPARHLGDRPVGDAFAIRKAAATEYPPSARGQTVTCFAGQTALADTRCAQDGEEHRLPVLIEALGGVEELQHLLVAPEKRSLQIAETASLADAGEESDRLVGGD